MSKLSIDSTPHPNIFCCPQKVFPILPPKCTFQSKMIIGLVSKTKKRILIFIRPKILKLSLFHSDYSSLAKQINKVNPILSKSCRQYHWKFLLITQRSLPVVATDAQERLTETKAGSWLMIQQYGGPEIMLTNISVQAFNSPKLIQSL